MSPETGGDGSMEGFSIEPSERGSLKWELQVVQCVADSSWRLSAMACGTAEDCSGNEREVWFCSNSRAPIFRKGLRSSVFMFVYRIHKTYRKDFPQPQVAKLLSIEPTTAAPLQVLSQHPQPSNPAPYIAALLRSSESDWFSHSYESCSCRIPKLALDRLT